MPSAPWQGWDALPIDQAASPYRKLAIDPESGGPSRVRGIVPSGYGAALGGSRICNQVAREAVRAAELLLRLSPLPAGLPHLDAYRRAFEARYGPDREVPLLELLDANFGLGPPSGFYGAHPAEIPARRRCVSGPCTTWP